MKPPPSPWQRGKRCPPHRASLPLQPAPDLRAPQGHRPGGPCEEDSKDGHGQIRTAPDEGLGQAPAGRPAAPARGGALRGACGLVPKAAAAKP